MTTTTAEVAALADRLAPYLPAAIARFGSLESAVDHLVALMVADADAAAREHRVDEVAARMAHTRTASLQSIVEHRRAYASTTVAAAERILARRGVTA